MFAKQDYVKSLLDEIGITNLNAKDENQQLVLRYKQELVEPRSKLETKIAFLQKELDEALERINVLATKRGRSR